MLLISAFILATFTLLFQSSVIPEFPLQSYAPFQALLFLHMRAAGRILWISALCGFLCDCLSSDPFGLCTAQAAFTAWLLYRFRSYLSSERWLHITLYAALIAGVGIAFQLTLLFLFDRRAGISGKWAPGDILGIFLRNALYTLLWFRFPIALGERLYRIFIWFAKAIKTKRRLSPTAH